MEFDVNFTAKLIVYGASEPPKEKSTPDEIVASGISYKPTRIVSVTVLSSGIAAASASAMPKFCAQ